MRIAIYYPWIYLKSGVERTILETIKGSKHKYTIFTSHYDPNGTFPEFKRLKVVELKKIPVQRDIFSVLKASITIILQKINLKGFHLLLVHSEGLGDLILARNNNIPVVCFCHTPLRPVFDIEYKTRAKARRRLIKRVIYTIFEDMFKIIDRYIWKKYSFIIFNSNESLRRAKHGGLISKKTRYKILHPGVDWENIKPSWKFEKYFLAPGRIMWTKNIELALSAFKSFSKTNNNYQLIVAGGLDEKSKKYYKRLRNMSAQHQNISFVTNPTDKQLSKLYSNCYAVLTTSFNEDWGLTAIEANAYGKPVISINTGGFKESQINNKTGFIAENNPNQISEKVTYLASHPKDVLLMGRFARNHSRRYTWNEFVKNFDIILKHYGKSES